MDTPNILQKNRTTLGGGVMIQVKNSCNLLNKHQVDFDGRKFFIAAVYNKPKANELEFVDALANFLSVKSSNKTLII